MFGRRILVLVAVLMGLTALAASLAPPPESGRQGRNQPSATPAPTPTVPGTQTAGGTVTARLRAPGDAPQQVTARVGDLVDITVTGNVIDTVVIPSLAVTETIAPGSPADIQLFADQAGSFPIRLLDVGRRIGVLRVKR
jgi:hypothetical protein